jgi:hypothetical protein
MSDLTAVCTLCSTEIGAQFTGATPTRALQTITGPPVYCTTNCYVADEIRFVSPSMLIFKPDSTSDKGNDAREFAVICRKLVIDGGTMPTNSSPCNPGDPGTRYGNTNLISWIGRLTSADSGAPLPPPAPQAPQTGANGTTGAQGNSGAAGTSPVGSPGDSPASLVVFALEVEVLNKGNLVVDWAGQNGGEGGLGQVGGNAGSGTPGTSGSDASWPSSGCSHAAGDGGPGGSGGAGGKGGDGGRGGNAGQILVISTSQNLSGAFSDSHTVTFLTTSQGGKGGNGAKGGLGANGGVKGAGSGECAPGVSGTDGTPLTSQVAATGAPGSSGTSPTPNPKLEKVTGPSCATSIPRALVFSGGGSATNFYRCSSGSASGKLSLAGQYLDQVASVATSLSGVTATIDSSSTETLLVLDIAAAANSATGLGDLIFTYTFPTTMTQTLGGAINIEVPLALSIAPASGARGATVNVTITGQAFDMPLASYAISVSGTDVTVLTPTYVNSTTLTASFQIGSGASETARDVTVKVGSTSSPCVSVLAASFTVT